MREVPREPNSTWDKTASLPGMFNSELHNYILHSVFNLELDSVLLVGRTDELISIAHQESLSVEDALIHRAHTS